MNKWPIALFVGFFLAQEITAVPPNPFEEIKDDRTVIYKSISTDEEKDFYWKNTKMGPDKVLDVIVPLAFITHVDRLYSKSNQRQISERFEDHIDRKMFAGELVESKNRSSLFFSTRYGMAMLTLWDISADRGQIVMIDDFINASVRGARATISINHANPTSNSVLWSLTFVLADVSYEFVIPDQANESRIASMDKQDVIQIAQSVIKTRKQRKINEMVK